MKTSNRFILFKLLLTLLLVISMAFVTGTAIGQETASPDEFTLDEIVVTAEFQEKNLQKTPISITAVTGETLELQNITSVQDLGLIIPNSAIRPQSNMWGPNAYIGIRGVDQNDFIPAFEPGVVVYIDDIFNETVVGSTLELVDLERVEVLRGPQGTLFGKNSIGGAIRLISKTPRGDNTGHLQVTYGTDDRLDFSGSYDFSLIEDRLFARISGSSKRIDGYMDRLDFTCQMNANGTPALAGTFPTTLRHYDLSQGNCKIGEKGGSQSDAAKLMLRWLPTDRLEINAGVDYTEIVSDLQAETLVRGRGPDYASSTAPTQYVDDLYQATYGISIIGNQYVTGNPFTVFESFEDPIYQIRWPDKINQEYTNIFARVDYDITDDVHAKFIFGYREYQQVFPTVNGTPFSFNAYLIDMRHDQTSYELRLNGMLFDERLDWTAGAYYYETFTHYLGYVTLGSDGVWADKSGIGAFIGLPFGFDNNDKFDNESVSAFVHGIFAITDKLSLTAGGRYTDEDKTFAFDHTNLFQIAEPLKYGGKHYDWKLSLDYEFTDDIMGYITSATGFRSEGANPRPWTKAQLIPTPDEEILMYEIGTKTQFLDNRLRINAAAFYNDYDPRVAGGMGYQCTDPLGTDPGEPVWNPTACPAGSYAVVNGLQPAYWFTYVSAPGTSKGFEIDITSRLIKNLDLNASIGWYNYETDVGPDDVGYIHPDYDLQADWSFSQGAQYRIHFKNGSMLIPRIDMFYQGERTTGALDRAPIPGNIIPAYTLFNGRLTYISSDAHWSVSLEAQNLFDKFYWINYPALNEYIGDTNNVQPSYGLFGLLAQPGRPRTLALSIRYNFF